MEENAAKFADDKMELLPYQHVREFRTVHLSYGRRTGKTRHILTHATSKDVVLIPSTRFVELYRHLEKDRYPDIYSGSQVLKQKEVLRYPVIWVEEPVLHENLADVLKKLIKDYDQTVVMVGA